MVKEGCRSLRCCCRSWMMPALSLASIYSILTWLFFPPADFSHSSSLFYFPEGQADLHARRKTEPRGSRPAERRWCALNLEAKLTNMCLLHNMQCRKTKTLLTKVKGLELACSRKLRVYPSTIIVSSRCQQITPPLGGPF